MDIVRFCNGRWLWWVAVTGGAATSFLVAHRLLRRVVSAIRRRRVLGRQDRVIVFSRYPVPGKSKTRLIPLLGERGASTCQLHMTDNLLTMFRTRIQSADSAAGKWCVELRYAGGNNKLMQHWMEPYRPSQEHLDTIWRPQAEGDLGRKMSEAFSTAFREGARRVVIIGSDIPGITIEMVAEAFATLEPRRDVSCDREGGSFTLGPALDGGYYLVAADCITSGRLDELFTGMTWGTETVRQQQIDVARSLQIEPTILPHSLSDLDIPSDFDVIGDCFGLRAADFHRPCTAVVIPALNEEANIEACLLHTIRQAAQPDCLRIVVSDGGSTDSTRDKVRALAEDESVLRGASLSLVDSPPGRGVQQNNGAAAAGDATYFVFVHADSRLPVNFDRSIAEFLSIPGNALGSFHFQLDCLEPDGPQVSWLFRMKMRYLTFTVKGRVASVEMPYGDQCLFLTRHAFEQCGGFPASRLMEDYILVKKMQRVGHVHSVGGPPCVTSCRRWMKHGLVRVSGMNLLTVAAYELGVQPNTLADIYYGKNHPAAKHKAE